jgi:hypothetical protein
MATGIAVPNRPDATWADQAELDNGDVQILAGDLYGVTSGCAVTAQVVPTYTITVAAGRGICGGVPVVVAGANIALATPTADPRFDFIVFDATGALSAITGTADANPRFPAVPDGKTVLAAVYIPSGASSYTNANIVDKRVFMAESFRRILPLPTSIFLSSRVTGASSDAFQVAANGAMNWNGDTSLGRTATGVLSAAATLVVQSATPATTGLRVRGWPTQQSFTPLQTWETAAGGVVASLNMEGTLTTKALFASDGIQTFGVIRSSNFRIINGPPSDYPYDLLLPTPGDMATDITNGTLWCYTGRPTSGGPQTPAWRQIAVNNVIG